MKKEQATRREFFGLAAGGVGLAIAGAHAWTWTNGLLGEKQPGDSTLPEDTEAQGDNLLTNPRYEKGAKFRLHEFIRRGADPKEAEAIFRRLTNLDPGPWVAAWTRLAEPWEHRATELEAQGKMPEATKAYHMAYVYYSIAKFPVINAPAKQQAYRKCIEMYLKEARAFDPPLERVVIPFEDKEIIGYLRLPKGIRRPPVVIATGGVDVYKEDRNTNDLLGSGFAAFSMDMPGAGQCPVWNTPDAQRLYTATIDYLETRPDLDAKRLGFIGRSYGGYWGAKMAYVERKRIRASVDWGGPIHYTFQEPWLRQLLDERLYLWSILDSMIYSNHVKDFAELLKQGPTMSLQEQGWLTKPCSPMLTLDGEKDPWITIQDVYILLENGEPKSARLYPNGLHMGGDPHSDQMVMDWLKPYLAS